MKVKDRKNVLIPDEIPFLHSLPLHYNLESKVYAFGMQQIAPSIMGLDVFPDFSLWGQNASGEPLASLTNCTI